MLRYHEVVYHYFVKKLRDPHKAGELYSNFALKLLESDRLIKNADPKLGRFRHYLMRTVHNMYIDSLRTGGKANPQPLTIDPPQPEPAARTRRFPRCGGRNCSTRPGKRCRTTTARRGKSTTRSCAFSRTTRSYAAPQIAEQLGPQLKRAITPDAVRQWLHRAREKFADLLLEEVEHLWRSLRSTRSKRS